MKEAICSLLTMKLPEENIPADLLKHEGNKLVTVIISIYQKICETEQWLLEWTKSLIVTKAPT